MRSRFKKHENRFSDFFESECCEENVANRLGRNMLYVHVRQRMIDVPRKILTEIYPVFYSDGLEKRRSKAYRRRGGWTCHGPNFMWSIDGYMKLKEFGIEVYAGIDAYSRHIMWFFCGISATTARTVLAQYVQMVREYEYLPLIMRADRGKETSLIAGAHYWLSRNAWRHKRPLTVRKPNIHRASLFGNRTVPAVPIRTAAHEGVDQYLSRDTPQDQPTKDSQVPENKKYMGISNSLLPHIKSDFSQVILSQIKPDPVQPPELISEHVGAIQDTSTLMPEASSTQGPGLASEEVSNVDIPFRDCWVYGKSTYNVKIERWWGSLSEGRAKFWRVSILGPS